MTELKEHSPQVTTGARSGPETVQIARLSNHYDFRYSEFAKGVNDRGRIIDISQGFTLNDPVDRYSNYHRFTVDFLEYRNTHFRCKECGKIFEDTPGQKFIYCPVCKVKGKEKEALPTIAGYTGACYADEFKLDIDDDTDLNQALEAARKVIKVFENEYSLPGRNINIVFSGSKGFHIKVPSECFGGFEPSPELPAIHKDMALEFVAGIAKIDKAVYDKTRLFRLPDTINSKTGLYCVQLSYEELFNLSIEQIKNLAKSPRGYELVEDPDYCPALAELYQKHKEFVKGNQTAVKTFSENGDGKADIDPGSISPWQIDKANQYYDEALDRFKGKLFDALNEGHNRDGRKLGRHDILLKLANQLRGLKIPSDEEEKYLFKFREDSNAICKERGFDPGRDIPDDELKNMLNDVGVYQERNKKKKAAQEPGASEKVQAQELEGTGKEPDYIPKVKLISLEEIQKTELPPLKWVIHDILPEGYAILASRSKVGKSWMALQFALAIGKGGKALSAFDVEKGTVLYFDIDQASQRSVKSRMDQLLRILPEKERIAPGNVFWSAGINRLHEGGAYELMAQIEKYNPSLVVIDTLRRFAPISAKGGYQEEYDNGMKLHEIALKYNIAILCIHHTTKASFDYIADEISGTSGVTAAADTLLVIKRTFNGMIFYVTGRDVISEEYNISFDKETGLWSVKGKADEFLAGNSVNEQIVQLLVTAIDEEYELSLGDIATIFSKDPKNIMTMLNRLIEKGFVERVGRGKYAPAKTFNLDDEIKAQWSEKLRKMFN